MLTEIKLKKNIIKNVFISASCQSKMRHKITKTKTEIKINEHYIDTF